MHGGHISTLLLLISLSTCLGCHTFPGPSIPWAEEGAHLCNHNVRHFLGLTGAERVSVHEASFWVLLPRSVILGWLCSLEQSEQGPSLGLWHLCLPFLSSRRLRVGGVSTGGQSSHLLSSLQLPSHGFRGWQESSLRSLTAAQLSHSALLSKQEACILWSTYFLTLEKNDGWTLGFQPTIQGTSKYFGVKSWSNFVTGKNSSVFILDLFL